MTASTARPTGTAAGSSIVDTGGLELEPDDPIEARVQEQARLAIAEADVIVFVVDAAAGITPADLEAAELLRRATSPVLVAVNKADNDRRELEAAEFYALGWEETYPISAAHGRGTGDLLDAIVWALPPETETELARKAREAEAEAWARDVADGFLEPMIVGAEPLDGLDGDGDGRGRRLRPRARLPTSTPPPGSGTRRSPPSPRTRRSRSRSSAARTSASRACSTPCSARSARSSATSRARPATRSTRPWPTAAARSS